MISVKNVSFTYPKSKSRAVSDLSFHIPRGHIFGLLGPSGAGKSTIQKLVTGLLSSYDGEIYINGQEIKRARKDFYYKLGVAFDTPVFYEKMTALENLQFFYSLYPQNQRRPIEWLERLGLAEAAHLPVGRFSKGMKMRLNFCRALLHEPEVLILDEPTSGLDPSWSHIVKKIIKEEQARGVTILMSTHHMETAKNLCDQIAFIVDGRISVIDSPHQLQLNYGRKMILFSFRNRENLALSFDEAGQHPQLLEWLKNGEVETIHSQEATLDEVFMQVTGRRLAE
ncbi:ABC transporter ATP-binding protein [Alteribacillus sp. HJP-4]|uniref:ABC transporter ATP-binding protein n=1 Tax=Alteribacillus sp. HJP-4 TaxID=2775394 RepID=UPI0035CD0682